MAAYGGREAVVRTDVVQRAALHRRDLCWRTAWSGERVGMGVDTTFREAGDASTAPRRFRWFRAETVCAAAAIVCFINTIPNGFCYDDNPIVRFNPKVNDPGQWTAVWTTDYWSEAEKASPNRDLLYRPIALSSYRLVRAIGGTSAWLHHAVNVALHALVCALVVLLCRKIGGSEAAACAAGLVFALLPIHTEAVASIVGRADLMATAGVLLAIMAHDRSMTAPSRVRTMWWRVGAVVAVFVAVGSKEAGAAVVPLVILFDWFRHCGRGSPSAGLLRWILLGARRLVYLLIPLAAYFLLRYHALGGRLYQQPPLTKTVNLLVDAPPWQHVLGVLQCFGMYWAKTVWPAVLSVKYSINAVRPATSLLDAHVLIGAAALVCMVVASVAAWRRGHRVIAVLSASIVLSYLPTANAFVLIQVFFAERIWYLPSVWIAIPVGLAVGSLVQRPAWRMAPAVVLAVLLAGMVVRCWHRNSEWKDNGTLYAAAYRDQPGGVCALHLYGEWLVDHGEYERGVELLDRAIEVDLGFTDAHRTLGRAHLRAGNLSASLRHLQIADFQVPGHPPTVADLSRVSRELVEQDEELTRLERLAGDAPEDVEVQLALVRRLRDLGLVGEALDRLREGDVRFARVVAWQLEYAVTLVYLNDRDGAIERYRRTLELSPEDPQVAIELAMLLLERRGAGDIDEAWQWSKRASTLAPGAPTVLACQAELTVLRGDLAGALALYEQAIQALPSDSAQRRIFEQRAMALGR